MTQNIYIISGGPGTGKTSVIKELKKKGFRVLDEAARKIALKDSRFISKNIKEINPVKFQKAIFELQRKSYLRIKPSKLIFSDRGFGDTLAYYKINNLRIPKEKFDYAKKFRFNKIFILNPLSFYVTDELRTESKKEQRIIQKEIINMYKKLDYKPIKVPSNSIKERVDFILKNMG